MPTTYRKADAAVTELAAELISQYHATLSEHRVRVDYVFACPELNDETGEPVADALKHHGVKALGIAKKLSIKERGLGRGDAEICLDEFWWNTADEEERRALLDHELHHLVGTSKRDDIGRPILKMRQHDYEFGWFRVIAERHGLASQERQQSAKMMEQSGQYFWPGITAARTDIGERAAQSIRSSRKSPLAGCEVTLSSSSMGKPVTISGEQLSHLAKIERQRTAGV